MLLSWLGGEPTLWPPLRSVGPALRALGLQLGLTTNGVHLDETLCAHLVDNYAQVTVSVDGLARWHDQVRGAPGLWAHLGTALRRLAEARAGRGAGPRLRANVVLMRSNLNEFAALCDYLAEWGVDEITFNGLGGLERPGDFFEREHLLPEHVLELRRTLPELRRPVLDCGPGQGFLFVDESGRVGPCSFTAFGHGRHISELAGVAPLRALPDLWRTRFATDRPAPCADCRSTQVFGKFAAP